ncbi:hypothetical protein OG792_05795 [Micromonospora sp. NBC_01699]|uniref:hypothetical protein n=1 Tax=Micromonospora sp. NBC_01699 TaxID=2975984 RepID=UPI002E36D9A5|nr:hypothetical protein [Micromonospora sp. NBC_01699]
MVEQVNRDEQIHTSDLINAANLGIEELEALPPSVLHASLRRLIEEVGSRSTGYAGFQNYLDAQRYVNPATDASLTDIDADPHEDGMLT